MTTICHCSYHSPHLDLKYLCKDFFRQKREIMTRDEHDALCEVEAKEFFVWLEGFVDGIGMNTPGMTEVFRIKERLDHLNMNWLDRGERAIHQCDGCHRGYPKNESGQHKWPSSGAIGGGAEYRACTLPPTPFPCPDCRATGRAISAKGGGDGGICLRCNGSRYIYLGGDIINT